MMAGARLAKSIEMGYYEGLLEEGLAFFCLAVSPIESKSLIDPMTD